MVFPETAHTDRDIALRDVPGTKPPEERMNIRSVRLSWVDPRSEEIIRMESGMEYEAASILALEPGVVKISAQFGKVWFIREGEWHWTYVDLCVEYANGLIRLVAVRRSEEAGDLKTDIELITNHTLHLYGHSIELMTEKTITKPAFKRAESILQARAKRNARDVESVYQALVAAGGVARVIEIVVGTVGMTPASGWDAVWSLIDEGRVVHDHVDAGSVNLEYHSFVRCVGE